jgi:hypothetical protein
LHYRYAATLLQSSKSQYFVVDHYTAIKMKQQQELFRNTHSKTTFIQSGIGPLS